MADAAAKAAADAAARIMILGVYVPTRVQTPAQELVPEARLQEALPLAAAAAPEV